VSKKLSVLMLGEKFLQLSTPSAQRLLAYAKTLTSNSHQTFIITRSKKSFRTEKMTVITTPSKKEIPVFDPIPLLFYFIRSISIIRTHRIDLILSTVPKINNAVVGVILSKIFNIPHIIDVRDHWESSLLLYPLNTYIPKGLVSTLIALTSLIYRQASTVITVNETLKQMLRERGISPDRICLIPNGADTSLFRPSKNEEHVKKLRKKHGLPITDPIFVYAGALTPHNRFDILLKGISRLRNTNNFMFLMISRPTLLITNKKIQQLIDKLQIQTKVKLLGSLPIEKTAELLRCCNVGIIPLNDEELLKTMTTAKVFAYLASGLPILASGPNECELEKLINSHKVGIFIGPPTPKGFANGFKRFLLKKHEMRKMGLKGREVMEKFYDRYALSRRIIEAIHSARERRRRRPR
jgi:glycosyltransferase involved in cell wall biosynthesis